MIFRQHVGGLVDSAVILAFSSYYLYESGRLPYWHYNGVSPGLGFLPMLLGTVGVALGATFLVKVLREHQASTATGRINWSDLANPLRVLAVLAGYVLVFPFLGYLLASAGMIWYLSWAFDPNPSPWRRARSATIQSVLVVGVFWFLFIRLFALGFPVLPSVG